MLPSMGLQRVRLHWATELNQVHMYGLPSGSDGKESTSSSGDPGSSPGSERSLGEGEWLPTLVFLPGESHGQRNLRCCSPWGYKEFNTTEQLNWTELNHSVNINSSLFLQHIYRAIQFSSVQSLSHVRLNWTELNWWLWKYYSSQSGRTFFPLCGFSVINSKNHRWSIVTFMLPCFFHI